MSMQAAAAVPAREAMSQPLSLRRPRASLVALSTAELARCTCPDACERDHDRD